MADYNAERHVLWEASPGQRIRQGSFPRKEVASEIWSFFTWKDEAAKRWDWGGHAWMRVQNAHRPGGMKRAEERAELGLGTMSKP